jgi:regulator of protease activity HflC (stomatin/prohibitin superfamily)
MLFILSLLVIAAAIVVRKTNKDTRTNQGALFALVLFILVAIGKCFTVIPAGHVGVIDFFGRVSDKTLKSGINVVNPLARIVKFSIKTQEIQESMEVPSKEGLSVNVGLSVLFHLDPEKAAQIYKTVGSEYTQILLVPQMRSVSRGVSASYEAKALYTSVRESLSKIIKEDLDLVVGPRGIVIESTPLRHVGLPPGLTQAIEEKLRAEQESQRMQFVLLKEKQEAERKKIEAQGISDFQNIVTKGISEPLLRWKGIEATEKLANSANTKTIIIGAGRDGLPLIMDTK